MEFRCCKCNKLLGKIQGEAEIKCPRCNFLNYVNKLPDHSEHAGTIQHFKLYTVGTSSR